MWDWIKEWLFCEPAKMIARGHALLRVGLFLAGVGVVAHAATAMLAIVQSVAPTSVPKTFCDTIGQPWLTWWIPESVSGMAFALALAAFGAWQVVTGKRLRTIYYGR